MDMQDLLADRRRFAAHADKKKLKKLADKGQNPVAVVISCSDSRVPVEVSLMSLNQEDCS